MKAADYWLSAQDGRVNWTRMTAFVGLAIILAAVTAILIVYIASDGEKGDMVLVLGTGLLLAGINVGQLAVLRWRPDQTQQPRPSGETPQP